MIDTLKSLGCFKKGNYTLKSGKKSNYYIDLRNLVSHPLILKKICIELNDMLNNCGTICGLPYAGIPYAQSISVLFEIPIFFLEKNKKNMEPEK